MEHVQFDSAGHRLLCIALNDRPLVWDLAPRREDSAESVPSILVTDVTDPHFAPSVVIVPQPIVDHVRIHADRPVHKYEIATLEGVVVHTIEHVIENDVNVNTKDYPSGMYILRVHSDDGFTAYPLVVQH